MTAHRMPKGQRIRTIHEALKRRSADVAINGNDLSDMSGVWNRFIVDPEKGKSIIQFGKTLVLLSWLGLELTVGKKPMSQKKQNFSNRFLRDATRKRCFLRYNEN